MAKPYQIPDFRKLYPEASEKGQAARRIRGDSPTGSQSACQNDSIEGDEQERPSQNGLWQTVPQRPEQPTMILLSSHSPVDAGTCNEGGFGRSPEDYMIE